MNYQAAVAWLYSTQEVGIKLGLESIRALLSELGLGQYLNPRPSCSGPTIYHIAGTNGKGSVCAMIDALSRASGRKTGLFTSPHLITYRERIRVDGEMIPEVDVARLLTRIRDRICARSLPPTFFEITTALALAWFAEQGVEVIVLETGLGGRLDSTNAVLSDVAVLTPISFDHHQYLGNTLEAIAGEKAGIIKAGRPVVAARQPASVAKVMVETAQRLGSPLAWAREPVETPVALAGSHQRYNAALALAAMRAVGQMPEPAVIARGLAEVFWPGRFQRYAGTPEVIVDGAHNEAAAVRLVQTWRETFGEIDPVVVFGALADKDLAEICRSFGPLGPDFIVAPVRNPRGAAPADVAAVFEKAVPGTLCRTAHSLEEAIAQAVGLAGERPVLITGSFFLVGQAVSLLEGQALEEVSAQ